MRIALIGGGAAAVSLTDSLLRRSVSPVEITIYESSGEVETIRVDDAKVDTRFEPVTDVRSHRGGVRITGGGVEDFDYAVLCLEGGAPTDFYGLTGAMNYHGDPHPHADLVTRIRKTAKVLVVGTGLAAVDTVLALRSHSHSGPIAMASRRGLLPAVHITSAKHELVCLTPRNLARMANRTGVLSLESAGDLLLAELRLAGVNRAAVGERTRSGVKARNRLKLQLNDTVVGSTWQSVLTTAAIKAAEQVWRALSPRDKDRFLLGYHHLFRSECNPMPPATAATLMTMLEEGWLAVHSDTRDIRVRPDQRFTLSALGREHAFDVVVNASRSTTFAPAGRPVIASLVERGAAVPHRYGGIQVDPIGNQVVDTTGASSSRLYAVGDLTAGEFYYVNSMEVITKHVDRVTSALLADAGLNGAAAR